MTWDYRIMKHPGGLYGLHEVYYYKNGLVEGWTQEPETGFWESVKELRMAHTQMLTDAMKRRTVLEYKP